MTIRRKPTDQRYVYGPAQYDNRRGEHNAFAKLTPEDVAAIRAERHPIDGRTRRGRAAGGTPVADLARRFGVSATTITHIVMRKSWAHVP